jgi:hypothetical protein
MPRKYIRNCHINNGISHDEVGCPDKFNGEEETCLEQAAIPLQVLKELFLSSYVFLMKKWGISLSINEFHGVAKECALSVEENSIEVDAEQESHPQLEFISLLDNLRLILC